MSSQLLRLNAFRGEPASSGFEWHFTHNHNSSADSSAHVDRLAVRTSVFQTLSKSTAESWKLWRGSCRLLKFNFAYFQGETWAKEARGRKPQNKAPREPKKPSYED